MKGHFKKRGASWYFWIELDPGPDGSRKQRSRGGFKTRKEAERAFAEFRDDIRRGTFVEPSKLTLSRFLEEEWFPGIRASVRPTTWEHYNRSFRNYVRPSIGRTLLPNLTPARLNAFYAELLESGRCNGDASTPGLSPKTVKHVHTMLHKALEDAVRWGHLAAQPGVARDRTAAENTGDEGLDAGAAPHLRRSRSLGSFVCGVASRRDNGDATR